MAAGSVATQTGRHGIGVRQPGACHEPGDARAACHWGALPISQHTGERSALGATAPSRSRSRLAWGRAGLEWHPRSSEARLRVRGPDRGRRHADLTILAKPACILARAQAVALAA
jgi:hypothetical protein